MTMTLEEARTEPEIDGAPAGTQRSGPGGERRKEWSRTEFSASAGNGVGGISSDEDSRKRTLSFSSEAPYRRYFGMEVLDHGEGAVDLGRLNGSGVLLFNHDVDQVLGKVLRAWVENGKGYAEVEFDSDEEAEKIFGKVKSGTLKTTSVRYQVDSWEEVKAGAVSADGRFTGPCSIARKWTPLEVSIVSVPADASVGVGRSEDSKNPDLSLYERQVQININRYGGKV